LIGADVACGSIAGKFAYLVPDIVRKGANTIIEVLRQTLKDLSDMLAKQGRSLPKKLYLQFDNCGENKVI
jgi:hypothetical protein